jgi:hypothetical protein
MKDAGEQAAQANNGRNPTKKRGRPKKTVNRHGLGKMVGGTRHTADMINAVNHRLAPELQHLVELADEGKTTLGVLAYVARFPPDQQGRMFDVLNPLGTRGAKRYVECLTKPPTDRDVAHRLLGWLAREFPAVPDSVIEDGLKRALAAWRVATEQEPTP